MTLRLVPVDSGKTIKLDKPVLLVGRNPDCDVILTDSRKVSRLHCLVACVEQRVFIRDLGSTNGVWLNGHRVEREARMRIGDELSFADLKYELVNGDAEAEPQPKKRSDPKPAGNILLEPAFNERETRDQKQNRPVRSVEVRKDRLMALPDESDSFVVEPSLVRVPKVPPRSSDELPLLSADDLDELPLARLAEEAVEDNDSDDHPTRRHPTGEDILQLSEDDLLPPDHDDPPPPPPRRPKKKPSIDDDDSEPVIRLDLSDG